LLAWFPVLALAMLAGILVAKRLYRELPFFFLYVCSALLVGVLRYAALHLGRVWYFYAYWISDLVISLLVLFAVYEVFVRRLFVKSSRTRFYRALFPIAGTIIFVLTVLTATLAPNKNAAFMMASRTFDFARTALLLFFIVLTSFMGRRWPRYEFGVALGFGVQAAIALVNAAVRVRLHYRPSLIDRLEFVAYDLSCIIWLITFVRSEWQASPLVLNEEMVVQANTWERTLREWLASKKNVI
jgi:hypothetical protein